MSGGKGYMRLPPLQVLRVKDPNRQQFHPCATAMTTVLAVENTLRACMDDRPPAQKGGNNVNYHLTRMTKRMTGPRKHKWPKD